MCVFVCRCLHIIDLHMVVLYALCGMFGRIYVCVCCVLFVAFVVCVLCVCVCGYSHGVCVCLHLLAYVCMGLLVACM